MWAAAVSMIQRLLASASSLVSPHAVMPWPPRMQPMASGFAALMAAMSRPSWKPGRRHGRQSLAVGGRRDRYAGIGVQVIDVRGVDEAVHRRVDRRGGSAFAMQRVVEGRDHLVFAIQPRVDVHEGAEAVKAQHREARFFEGAEVAAGALDPHQLDILAGNRVDRSPLGAGVAAGVVRVAGVGAESIRSGDQFSGSGVRAHSRSPWGSLYALKKGGQSAYAPQLACVPPTRSALIFS
jgi:hypothetical protein